MTRRKLYRQSSTDASGHHPRPVSQPVLPVYSVAGTDCSRVTLRHPRIITSNTSFDAGYTNGCTSPCLPEGKLALSPRPYSTNGVLLQAPGAGGGVASLLSGLFNGIGGGSRESQRPMSPAVSSGGGHATSPRHMALSPTPQYPMSPTPCYSYCTSPEPVSPDHRKSKLYTLDYGKVWPCSVSLC